jgi:kumamolisin
MNQSGKSYGVAVLRGLYVVLCSAMLLFVMGAQAQAQSLLTRHVRQGVVSGEAKFLNRLPETQTLRIDIVLPLRDPAGLEKFLHEVYDPSSPSYRHFLTVPEFTARFGPTQEDYYAVIDYATANGFKVVGGSRDGMDVQVEGSVTSIEAAFNVSMGVYQHPTENRTFYAPDREPAVYLPFPLWHVSGLDNYSIPHPLYQRRNLAVKSNATTGSGPSASFLGSDMRAAYYEGTALTGTGQNIGLFEYYGYDISDLATYYKNAGQTMTATVTGISTDGTSLSCLASQGCDDTEQILDMTQALGMAPGITTLYVYVGSTDSAILSAMTTDKPLPAQLSCSWGWSPADPSTDDPYYKKMAAQGQTFFVAAGDSDEWTRGNYPYPAEDANVTAVGGTDLTTSSAGGPWSSEIGWVDGGGGISPDRIAIPSWQQLSGVINSSNKGSTVYRNGPDVSANANFTYYVCADQEACTANEYGGTSFAAPMWAGYMALANQQALLNGNALLGFINPTIYALGLGSGYAADFHDITSGNNGFPAVTGYDLDTGWGSPNGSGLINALARTSSGPNFTISASPSSLSVAQGSNGTSTIATAVSGGFNSAIALSASGQPTTVTVSFNPTSIAAPGSGTSTMTMAVASTTATGTYTITVTGTGGGITQTAAVNLTVTSPANANFTLSASPTTITVVRGSSGTSTITTAALNGFNSAIALSATGQPSGVTVSFSLTPIPAPGSGTSTMKVTTTSRASTGSHTITITGTGGGKTNKTAVTLTVRR